MAVAKTRSKVVLPAPLSPVMRMDLPAGSSAANRASTHRLPRRTERSSRAIAFTTGLLSYWTVSCNESAPEISEIAGKNAAKAKRSAKAKPPGMNCSQRSKHSLQNSLDHTDISRHNPGLGHTSKTLHWLEAPNRLHHSYPRYCSNPRPCKHRHWLQHLPSTSTQILAGKAFPNRRPDCSRPHNPSDRKTSHHHIHLQMHKLPRVRLAPESPHQRHRKFPRHS